eukprot:scaffold10856_cov63-Phaeocystis_antarctica.AAC.5
MLGVARLGVVRARPEQGRAEVSGVESEVSAPGHSQALVPSLASQHCGRRLVLLGQLILCGFHIYLSLTARAAVTLRVVESSAACPARICRESTGFAELLCVASACQRPAGPLTIVPHGRVCACPPNSVRREVLADLGRGRVHNEFGAARK